MRYIITIKGRTNNRTFFFSFWLSNCCSGEHKVDTALGHLALALMLTHTQTKTVCTSSCRRHRSVFSNVGHITQEFSAHIRRALVSGRYCPFKCIFNTPDASLINGEVGGPASLPALLNQWEGNQGDTGTKATLRSARVHVCVCASSVGG